MPKPIDETLRPTAITFINSVLPEFRLIGFSSENFASYKNQLLQDAGNVDLKKLSNDDWLFIESITKDLIDSNLLSSGELKSIVKTLDHNKFQNYEDVYNRLLAEYITSELDKIGITDEIKKAKVSLGQAYRDIFFAGQKIPARIPDEFAVYDQITQFVSADLAEKDLPTHRENFQRQHDSDLLKIEHVNVGDVSKFVSHFFINDFVKTIGLRFKLKVNGEEQTPPSVEPGKKLTAAMAIEFLEKIALNDAKTCAFISLLLNQKAIELFAKKNKIDSDEYHQQFYAEVDLVTNDDGKQQLIYKIQLNSKSILGSLVKCAELELRFDINKDVNGNTIDIMRSEIPKFQYYHEPSFSVVEENALIQCREFVDFLLAALQKGYGSFLAEIVKKNNISVLPTFDKLESFITSQQIGGADFSLNAAEKKQFEEELLQKLTHLKSQVSESHYKILVSNLFTLTVNCLQGNKDTPAGLEETIQSKFGKKAVPKNISTALEEYKKSFASIVTLYASSNLDVSNIKKLGESTAPDYIELEQLDRSGQFELQEKLRDLRVTIAKEVKSAGLFPLSTDNLIYLSTQEFSPQFLEQKVFDSFAKILDQLESYSSSGDIESIEYEYRGAGVKTVPIKRVGQLGDSGESLTYSDLFDNDYERSGRFSIQLLRNGKPVVPDSKLDGDIAKFKRQDLFAFTKNRELQLLVCLLATQSRPISLGKILKNFVLDHRVDLIPMLDGYSITIDLLDDNTLDVRIKASADRVCVLKGARYENITTPPYINLDLHFKIKIQSIEKDGKLQNHFSMVPASKEFSLLIDPNRSYLQKIKLPSTILAQSLLKSPSVDKSSGFAKDFFVFINKNSRRKYEDESVRGLIQDEKARLSVEDKNICEQLFKDLYESDNIDYLRVSRYLVDYADSQLIKQNLSDDERNRYISLLLFASGLSQESFEERNQSKDVDYLKIKISHRLIINAEAGLKVDGLNEEMRQRYIKQILLARGLELSFYNLKLSGSTVEFTTQEERQKYRQQAQSLLTEVKGFLGKEKEILSRNKALFTPQFSEELEKLQASLLPVPLYDHLAIYLEAPKRERSIYVPNRQVPKQPRDFSSASSLLNHYWVKKGGGRRRLPPPTVYPSINKTKELERILQGLLQDESFAKRIKVGKEVVAFAEVELKNVNADRITDKYQIANLMLFGYGLQLYSYDHKFNNPLYVPSINEQAEIQQLVSSLSSFLQEKPSARSPSKYEIFAADDFKDAFAQLKARSDKFSYTYEIKDFKDFIFSQHAGKQKEYVKEYFQLHDSPLAWIESSSHPVRGFDLSSIKNIDKKAILDEKEKILNSLKSKPSLSDVNKDKEHAEKLATYQAFENYLDNLGASPESIRVLFRAWSSDPGFLSFRQCLFQDILGKGQFPSENSDEHTFEIVDGGDILITSKALVKHLKPIVGKKDEVLGAVVLDENAVQTQVTKVTKTGVQILSSSLKTKSAYLYGLSISGRQNKIWENLEQLFSGYLDSSSVFDYKDIIKNIDSPTLQQFIDVWKGKSSNNSKTDSVEFTSFIERLLKGSVSDKEFLAYKYDPNICGTCDPKISSLVSFLIPALSMTKDGQELGILIRSAEVASSLYEMSNFTAPVLPGKPASLHKKMTDYLHQLETIGTESSKELSEKDLQSLKDSFNRIESTKYGVRQALKKLLNDAGDLAKSGGDLDELSNAAFRGIYKNKALFQAFFNNHSEMRQTNELRKFIESAGELLQAFDDIDKKIERNLSVLLSFIVNNFEVFFKDKVPDPQTGVYARNLNLIWANYSFLEILCSKLKANVERNSLAYKSIESIEELLHTKKYEVFDEFTELAIGNVVTKVPALKSILQTLQANMPKSQNKAISEAKRAPVTTPAETKLERLREASPVPAAAPLAEEKSAAMPVVEQSERLSEELEPINNGNRQITDPKQFAAEVRNQRLRLSNEAIDFSSYLFELYNSDGSRPSHNIISENETSYARIVYQGYKANSKTSKIGIIGLIKDSKDEIPHGDKSKEAIAVMKFQHALTEKDNTKETGKALTKILLNDDEIVAKLDGQDIATLVKGHADLAEDALRPGFSYLSDWGSISRKFDNDPDAVVNVLLKQPHLADQVFYRGRGISRLWNFFRVDYLKKFQPEHIARMLREGDFSLVHRILNNPKIIGKLIDIASEKLSEKDKDTKLAAQLLLGKVEVEQSKEVYQQVCMWAYQSKQEDLSEDPFNSPLRKLINNEHLFCKVVSNDGIKKMIVREDGSKINHLHHLFLAIRKLEQVNNSRNERDRKLERNQLWEKLGKYTLDVIPFKTLLKTDKDVQIEFARCFSSSEQLIAVCRALQLIGTENADNDDVYIEELQPVFDISGFDVRTMKLPSNREDEVEEKMPPRSPGAPPSPLARSRAGSGESSVPPPLPKVEPPSPQVSHVDARSLEIPKAEVPRAVK